MSARSQNVESEYFTATSLKHTCRELRDAPRGVLGPCSWHPSSAYQITQYKVTRTDWRTDKATEFDYHACAPCSIDISVILHRQGRSDTQPHLCKLDAVFLGFHAHVHNLHKKLLRCQPLDFFLKFGVLSSIKGLTLHMPQCEIFLHPGEATHRQMYTFVY